MKKKLILKLIGGVFGSALIINGAYANNLKNFYQINPLKENYQKLSFLCEKGEDSSLLQKKQSKNKKNLDILAETLVAIIPKRIELTKNYKHIKS